ncbi:hypothetical protein HYPDE_40078 [Hyphomicrobium denitrificans 1NES1]|uniref:Transmembrane protein n=1 Tax=Hyphomicrobium denitrificans 1NES1 TaxID=670307 RepID=N0B7R9_9HYPH|nr:hypothetical protein HYPDE_40078 [Hyphomicrobium denitrificans 1NES1]
MKFLGSIARVAFGFILASIAAGLVMMLFVNTPSEVLAQPVSRLPRTAGETFELALLTATHVAVFAFIFALIVAGLGELFSLRGVAFYLSGGVAIAFLGFIAQYASEVPGEPTILNNYALKTFLTTGFFAGFVYWLASGQFAGRVPTDVAAVALGPSSPEVVADPHPENRDEETSVVIRHPAPLETPRPTYRTLLNRLSFKKRETSTAEPESRDGLSDSDKSDANR